MIERYKIRELERMAKDAGARFIAAKVTGGNHIRASFDYAGRAIDLIVANSTSDNKRSYLNNRAQLRRQIRSSQ